MGDVEVDQKFRLAANHHLSGRLPEAERIYREILARQPQHAGAFQYLGVLCLRLGRVEEAIDLIRRAVALQPNDADAHGNLGNALRAKGDFAGAGASYQRAIELNPGHAEAYFALAELQFAMESYARASDSLGKAIQIRPDFAGAWILLATVLIRLGKSQEALAAAEQAIRLSPNSPEAHVSAAWAQQELGLREQALASLQAALKRRREHVEAHVLMAIVLKSLGRIEEAMGACREAIRFGPDHAQAHCYLGNLYTDNGQIEEAVACFKRCEEIAAGDWRITNFLPFSLQYQPGVSPAEILAANVRWAHRHASPLKSVIRPHANDGDPERGLRIGYFSPNLREHVDAHLFKPVLENSGGAEFEIFIYASVPFSDEVTRAMQSLAHAWRDIVGISDEAAAEMIRADRIDVLIDAGMHLPDGRPLIFARKPAPVQAAWAAYPGTTGMESIDYRMTDPYLDPPGIGDEFYSERSWRLPHCFWPYDPGSRLAVGELPAERNGYVTFGCLNAFKKINDGVLECWSGLLRRVKRSHLVLLAPQTSRREYIVGKLGTDRGRVEFVAPRPREEYLRTYDRIDIALDTLPYNGHITTLDAAWMGVPVVSIVGKTVVGRAGLSILSNLGLRELATGGEEEFIERAADLAADLPRLGELRRGLRRRTEASPMMNGKQFAADLQAAYRQMWRNWCQTRHEKQ